MRISTKAAEAAKVGARLTDDLVIPGGGRLVLIAKDRAKRWIIRSRAGGKDRSTTIGHFPDMGVAEARTRALEIARGERPDPRRRGGTLRLLLEGYVEHLGERPHARTALNLSKWLLGREWEHALASKAANMVEPEEIAALLRARFEAGATTSVNRARATLHAAYRWGATRDLDPTRPSAGAVFAIRSNPVSLVAHKAEFERARKTVIPTAVLRAIWADLKASGQEGAFARLALLTAQRLDQLARATVEGDVLVVVDTKGRGARAKRNVLPLTKAMRIELASGALQLPGGRKVLSSALKPRGFVGPDIRRTAETFLAEAGWTGESRGRLLSHGLERSALVAKHYDMSETLTTKRTMLEAWARHLQPTKKRN